MSVWSRMYRNDTNFDFPAYWKRVLAVSMAIALIGGISLLTRGLNLGLEFEGGAAWELPSNGVSTDEARDAMRSVGLADARIQTGDDVLRIRVELDPQDARVEEVTLVLVDLTGAAESEVSVSTAGPSWGDEITDKAVQALIIFFIVIAIYITLRLRWEMAVGALVAVAHDLLVTVGLYSIFQWEVTPSTVIAFLTIMGYSLYDTMVVFDKVKDNEYRLANSRLSPTEVMNLSLNQVLMRSLNTSITSMLPVLSVLVVGSFMMGAVTLQEFAVALLIGLAIGTYSSLFVAAPIATWLRERTATTESSGSRQYRLSDAVRRRDKTAGRGSSPVAGSDAIPARPRKQKRGKR
ncbi:MAG: protein translocase subunit SecF [Acidimicrobiales bacterium]